MHLVNGAYWPAVLAFLIVLAGILFFAYFRKGWLLNVLFSRNQQATILSNYSPRARLFRTIALVLALFFLGFSFMDPRWGSRTSESSMEGIDVVVVADISRSMQTPDVTPSRLEYAKKLVMQLLNLLLGNRIGLTAFAGFAFNVIPLTADTEAAGIFVSELSSAMIDLQGTNLEDAIRRALELFDKNTLTHKAVVIFTDGEDREFSPLSQVQAAKNDGVSIFTVGIGTPNGGAIPLLDEYGRMYDYLKKDGQVVTSRLNEALLKRIAEETQGFYVRGSESAVIQLADRLNEIKKTRFGNNKYEFMEPQFQYFLLIAVLLLLVFLFMPERKIRLGGLPKLFGAAALLLLAFHPRGLYATDASKGCDDYRSGNYIEALTNFQKAVIRSPRDDRLVYNQANSFYQLRDFENSVSNYLNLTNSANAEARKRSYYNLGNSYLEKGDYASALPIYRDIILSENPDSPLYKKALQNYLLIKQMPPQTNTNQQKQQDKKDDKKQDQKQQQDKNQDKDKKDQQQNRQDQKTQKPIKPSDYENLLQLIQEEEKKHIDKKENRNRILIKPKDDW